MSNLRNKFLTYNSRQLRKNMTKEEKHLWYDFLKLLPIKVNRQKVMGNYIVDFLCKEANLIIEVDGDQHLSDIEVRTNDEARDEYFKKLGLKVLRINNVEVNKNFKGACVEILKYMPPKCAQAFLGFELKEVFTNGESQWMG